MHNPMQQANFMARGSPPAPSEGEGGPPIAKKQRGGRTPASIRRHQIQNAATTAAGRAVPRPPTGAIVDDAIARRRAELRRLQERSKADRAAAVHRTTTTTKKKNGGGDEVSKIAAAVQGPPMRPAGVGRHHSDLFPSVQPKSPSLEKNTLIMDDTLDLDLDLGDGDEPKRAQTAAFGEISNFNTNNDKSNNNNNIAIGGGPPPPSMETATAVVANSNPNLPPETPLGNAIPPTPAIGRRLEFPSTQKARQRPSPPVRRARSKSPTPTKSTTATGISSTTKTKAAVALAERRRRARSAPPRRPPPPPGPPPSSSKKKGTNMYTPAKELAKKKIKARRPRPVQPASLLGEGTPIPIPPTIQSEQNSNNNNEATTKMETEHVDSETGTGTKASNNTVAEEEGPPVPAQAPPPTRVSSLAYNTNTDDQNDPTEAESGETRPGGDDGASNAADAVGLGTIDTSKIVQQYPSKIPSPIATKQPTTTTTTSQAAEAPPRGPPILPMTMTTPVSQRGTFLGDGQKTPPSTGSSARRHKLKLMNEQALAAADLVGTKLTTTGTSNSSSSSSNNPGGDPPATAAFAAALGMPMTSTNHENSNTNTTTDATTQGPPKTPFLGVAPDLLGQGRGASTNTSTTTSTSTTGLPPPGKNVSLAPRGAKLPPFGKVALSASITTGGADVDADADADVDIDITTADSHALPPLQSKSQSRLEEAYTKSERDKTAALIKIKNLEDRLKQKTQEDIDRMKGDNTPLIVGGLDTIVEELLSMAKAEGPDVALGWIAKMKGQFQQSSSSSSLPPPSMRSSSPLKPASRVGFDTGIRGVGGFGGDPTLKSTIDGEVGFSRMETTPSRQRIARRNLTPHPTKHRRGGPEPSVTNNITNNDGEQDDDDEEHPEEMEKRLIEQFREAVQYVPYEFSSDLANFTVRRPYGIDLQSTTELFEYVKPPQQTLDAYSKAAHVSAKPSIEVVAIIKADNSPLLLFGTAGVRYNTHHHNSLTEWTHINNVDTDLDRPLGHITYIDEQAMEREYSLDAILEEALLVREQYCGTVTSTALGFDGRGPVPAKQEPPVQQVQVPGGIEKAPSRDIGVETDERGIGTDAPLPQQQQQEQQEQGQGQSSPPVEKIVDDPGASSDVLIVFIGMMGTLLVKLLFGVVIGIPLRIVRAIIVFTFAYIIIQFVHMQYADGYNQWLLRLYNDPAIPSTSYVLTDLVYYTNREPGIM